jgi:hypothetical protein
MKPTASPPEIYELQNVATKKLTDGARVIREMMRSRHLEAAGFFESYPDPKPSDFVNYINSGPGEVLWPLREGSPFLDETHLEHSHSIGEGVIPKGIAYRRNRPDPDGGLQVVYLADDEAGEVVVEAYIDPTAAPAFVRRWKLLY